MREKYEDSYYTELLDDLYEKESPCRHSLFEQFEATFGETSKLGEDFAGLSFNLPVDEQIFSSHFRHSDRTIPKPYWYLQIRSADKFSVTTVEAQLIEKFETAINSIDRKYFPEGDMYDFVIDYYCEISANERTLSAK